MGYNSFLHNCRMKWRRSKEEKNAPYKSLWEMDQMWRIFNSYNMHKVKAALLLFPSNSPAYKHVDVILIVKDSSLWPFAESAGCEGCPLGRKDNCVGGNGLLKWHVKIGVSLLST